MRNIIRLPGVLPLLVLIALSSVLISCGHEDDRPVANQAPQVRITGGPLDGSEAAYTARVYWTGWDFDGIIDHYEYAIDPPVVFTEREIARPDSFPDIRITVLPGPSERQDTLVVSKVVEGVTYQFRWVETIQFSRSFAFETPEADSVAQGSTQVPVDTFSGTHTVYLRAVDDDGAYSELDRIGYKAKSITPTATIRRPSIVEDILTLGSTLTLEWDGLDPDSPDARKKPTGYLYKLLRLDTLTPPLSILRVIDPNVLYTRGDPTWTYQRADTLRKTFFLGVPGQYVLGVRAVDVAGAVEPFLQFGRNAFKFQTFASGGAPALTITEPSLGTYTFRGIDKPVEVEVPVGAKLRFTWQGSAEAYGGSIEGYSWGLDIPDLEREGPTSGWSGWGQILGNFQPITYSKPGIHVLYVRTRDTSGIVSLGSLILRVIDFPLDREVLWVDDWRNQTYPRDEEHDAFWESLFRDSGLFDMATDFFKYEIHGERDTYSQIPLPPKLEDMGRYKLIVWENFGDGYNGQSGLLSVASLTRFLGAYLQAGGKVWVGGGLTVPAMLPSPNKQNMDATYPKDVTNFPDSFAFQFMKLASSRIMNAKGSPPDDNLVGVKPFPNRTAYYPAMEQDPAKVSPFKGSVSHGDVILDPIYVQDAGYTGIIDSLYVYQAKQGKGSYHNRLNALRWHNPDPVREHGRTQWFGFQIYYMKKAQIQDTFNRAIEWFRQEQPPGAGS